MTELELTIPLVPPSANHYKVPRVRRGHLHWYLTPEAKAFKRAAVIIAAGRTIAPESDRERDKVRYELRLRVVLGKGQRGDADNFCKCVADGLQDAGVIHNDSRIRRWHIEVDDEDRSNPRTEIFVRVLPPEEA